MSVLRAATLALLLATGSCCDGPPDSSTGLLLEGTFAGQELEELRSGTLNDDERCLAACRMLGSFDRMLTCTAYIGDGDGDGDALSPWDPAHTEVGVLCQVEFHGERYCNH